MKKLFVLSIIVMTMSFPSQVFANYLITLKSGREMVTVQYWEEGEQIKFYRYGGVAGVNRERVEKIEKTTRDAGKEIVSQPLYVAKQEDVKKTGKKAASPGADVGKRKDTGGANLVPLVGDTREAMEIAGTEPEKEKKMAEDPYILEFESLKMEFDQVRFKEDPVLYTYAKQLTGFRDKVLNERLGHVYSDQLVEVYSILAEVESVVKSN
jgi:hypothetical protein